MVQRAVVQPPDPDLAQRYQVVQAYAGGEGWSAAVRPRGGGPLQFLKVLEAGIELSEPSLLASLEHPAIPRILEAGRTADGRAWFAREHLDGVSLADVLPLSPDAVEQLAVDLLEVLAYVHLRGVLHLDLKPQNVLRLANDDRPAHALLDFGLGRRGGGPASGGTILYASPEVLLALEPDARSDLFSLGALLFVALRDRRAPLPWQRFRQRFPHESFFDVFGVAPASLPAPFDTFLPRLLARAPDARFADAQEALEAIVGGTGRPSPSLLWPDPIAFYGARLERELARLQEDDDLVLQGEAEEVQSLAVHAACRLGDVRVVQERAGECVLRRGGGGRMRFAVPPLTVAEVARHLEDVTSLDVHVAETAALAVIESGASTPARIGRLLLDLVESGRIQPEGPRWIWPDAMAGRVSLTPPHELLATPAAIGAAAARGHVEAALRAYRTTAAALGAEEERPYRAALAEGLLRAGEPARARPFVHDLPVLRARMLLDLGEVTQAARAIATLADLDPAGLEASPQVIARLRAQLRHEQGDVDEAERILAALVADEGAPEDRMTWGLVLVRQGRVDEAVAALTPVLEQLDVERQPFLRAAALMNLAEAERARGELDAALRHHEEALSIYRALGHVRYTALTFKNLGVLAKDRGDHKAALAHLRRARALFGHVRDQEGAAVAEANLGIAALEAGDAATAVRRLQQALDELERLGARRARPLVLLMLARAHAVLGHRDQAEAILASAGPVPEGRLMDEARKVREALAPSAPPTQRDVTPSPRPAPAAAAGGGDPGFADGVFRTFLAVNRRLANEADLESAMRFLLDAAVTLAGGRLGYLLVARPDGLRMEVRVGQGSEEAMAFSRSMVNRALQRRQVLTDTDVQGDRELRDMPSVRDLRLRSAICVPFVSSSGIQGAIYVEHSGRPGAFGPVEKERLDVLADQAAIAVDRMQHEEQLARELERSRRDLQVARHALRESQATRMLGKSKAMKELRAQIEKLAPSDLSVLVLGETGSGKELVARAVHAASARAKGPFVAENCSTIPAELMESELFGHVKGSFTGADEDRPGLLELASGGTLFLDEVGDMPAGLQAKLLRALQEGSIRRVGGKSTIPVDLRLVCATHKDLKQMVQNGEFRADLFYRIAAAEIRVPPLRARGMDIVMLAEEFVERLNRKHRRHVVLGEDGKRQLLEYPWPGNVRELEHVVSRAFVLNEDTELNAFYLPDASTTATPRAAAASSHWPVISLAEAEARTIRAALEATGGDKTKAAKLLGISRTALYDKLKRMA